MQFELTDKQKRAQDEFRSFADIYIAPYAAQFDQEEYLPIELIDKLAEKKYLTIILPETYCGLGFDMITFGLLSEEIGRACSSVRSLLTVHGMVSYAILRWGTQAQKEVWLPQLATGNAIGAFGLTEPNAGSDINQIETIADQQGDIYVLNGQKKWITFGQIANLFLIFAKCDGRPSAFLVEKCSPGLTIEPTRGILGTRASMVATLSLENCQIPINHLIGGVGFGISTVALSALDLGRYSVAWGCVGIADASLHACLEYTTERKQFGKQLKDHQLIQEMITNMVTNVKAARLLCYHAGYLKDIGSKKAMGETLVAKYFASTTASKAASDAVQIHGGNGCGNEYPVQRYFRDAKIMEIIEGSNQMQQILISNDVYRNYG